MPALTRSTHASYVDPVRNIYAACLVLGLVAFGASRARADGGSDEGSAEPTAGSAEHHDEGSAAGSAEPAVGSAEPAAGSAEHHDEGSAAPAAGSSEPVAAEHHDEVAPTPPTTPAPAAIPDGAPEPAAAALGDEDEQPDALPFDADGDGKVEPDEIATEKEYEADFQGMPKDVDENALAARPPLTDMLPSISIDQFRTLLRVVKKVVLERMDKKIQAKTAARMATFGWLVFAFSCLGLLLLGMPLVLAKKYPGKGGMLFKYSALAAGTFFVTVNLFGGVLFFMRTAQGAMGSYTNPGMAIAGGFFDTLDQNAPDYVVMGKELFVPTLDQLRGETDEQPTVALLANGTRLIKDANVFVSIAKMFKKVDFIFGILPIVLMTVTMLLFVLAIRPTLLEIIKLPAVAAASDDADASHGRAVVLRSLARVKGELLATLCTLGVLAVLTLVSALVLGEIVTPALDALLRYFSLALSYLQFVPDASSGLVFMTLFGVILFLVLNLAALILSMSFFLGKSQKIFQARFNAGTPIATHARFFKWGVPAVLLVQVLPWLFALVAGAVLGKINDSLTGGVADAAQISWTKLMMAGPLFLIVGFGIVFWAARGVKAIAFLQRYKVKAPAPAAVDDENRAAA